jgi:salicylate hydroxylase
VHAGAGAPASLRLKCPTCRVSHPTLFIPSHKPSQHSPTKMTISNAEAKSAPTIAIVGGGIAGLTLTIALLKHAPHLPVTLYEAASAFGEIGAGVGFEPVMVRTMGLIDPRIAAAFEKCSKGNSATEPPKWFTVRVGDQRKIIGELEDAVVLETGSEKKKVRLGEEIFRMPARRGPRGGIHRAHFLDELVKLVPEGIAQFQKRLSDVTKVEDGSGMFFTIRF